GARPAPSAPARGGGGPPPAVAAAAVAAAVLGTLRGVPRERLAAAARRAALARLPGGARIALPASEGSLARALVLPLALRRGSVLALGWPLRRLTIAAAGAITCAGTTTRTLASAGTIAAAGTVAGSGTATWTIAGAAACLRQSTASRAAWFAAVAALFVEAARDVLRRALPRGLAVLSLVFPTDVRVAIP